MKLDVQVISTDTIKPSSSTPDRLRHHTLSFVDQIAPSIFMPFLLFYPRDGVAHLSNEERQTRIKKSLSEALTRFYPLAGRIKDNFHVDCNDEGVHYVEAKATCQLSEFLEDPNPDEHNKFLPYELDDVNEVALAVQLTTFDCGGIVIGVVFAHKVADASSLIFFLKSWAAIARGSSNIATPHFESATIFPPVTSPSFILSRLGTGNDKISTKRFVFEGSAIAALRDKYSTDDTNIEYPRPTRVEALSAFLYSRYLAATQPDPSKLYSLCHAINVRTRLDPPLSENYFGNISLSTGFVISSDTKDVFRRIVIPLRDAISKVDMDYVKSFQTSGGSSNVFLDNLERFRKGEVILLAFTSLCRFPVYDEADFGWGKPVWFASAKLLFKNLFGFFDTKSGNGIEAWINLDEEDMAKFEVDKELLSYVSSAKVSAI
ncbi:stemmadenine O-acetyltransferase-like [Corylus avellana]|uniref:stemmadenine O-acetyltransferase-like n=1 Tax=Corylus avellana TaxID=13451 RepID=UPI001E213C89|nr:stemmadenine O-acetyltransferase-like [Corylus avellana]